MRCVVRRASFAAPTSAAVLATGAMLAACAGEGAVTRVVDGHTVQGRFVGEEAYSEYLRGALKEEKGDLRGALAAYESAAAFDPASADTWARLGRLRCQVDPSGDPAGPELAEALRLDPGYEPALEAQRFCLDVRARGLGHAQQAAREASLDPWPHAPPSQLPYAAMVAPHLPGPAASAAERAKLEALTLLHRESVGAWTALAAWGGAHGDTTLAVRGLVGVARLDPASHASLALAVVALAGAGHAAAARTLAGELVDRGVDRTAAGLAPGPASSPLVARLSLDEAIAEGDVERIEARASRTHLGLEVAAGRAWAVGDRTLARALALRVTRSDPGNLEARLVVDGASGRATSWGLERASRPGGAAGLRADVLLPFARDVLLHEGAVPARRALGAELRLDVAHGDALLASITVELAVAGALADTALTPDARVEAIARRGDPLDPTLAADPSLDARHALLALALLRPADDATLRAAQRLAGSVAEDPLVAAALARLSLTRGEPPAADALSRLEASAPSDPIAAAALVDAARRGGTTAALTRARAAMASLAKTPAERARARE
jgi:hypothetical protein